MKRYALFAALCLIAFGCFLAGYFAIEGDFFWLAVFVFVIAMAIPIFDILKLTGKLLFLACKWCIDKIKCYCQLVEKFKGRTENLQIQLDRERVEGTLKESESEQGFVEIRTRFQEAETTTNEAAEDETACRERKRETETTEDKGTGGEQGSIRNNPEKVPLIPQVALPLVIVLILVCCQRFRSELRREKEKEIQAVVQDLRKWDQLGKEGKAQELYWEMLKTTHGRRTLREQYGVYAPEPTH